MVPHSKANLAFKQTEQVLKRHQTNIKKYRITTGYLVTAVSNNVFVLETVLWWPDELKELHQYLLESDHLNGLNKFPANVPARKAVEEIRQQLLVVYQQLGGVQLQIGKDYPFKQSIAENNFAILQEIKRQLDPDNRINPGCLGFD